MQAKIQHLTGAGVCVRVKNRPGGYQVLVSKEEWSKRTALKVMELLRIQGIPSKFGSTCEEKAHASILVPEDFTAWPYVGDTRRTLQAVAEDSSRPSQEGAMSLREAILLGLRYAPDVKNAEIDRLIQKFSLRQADWNYEWQYGLNGSTNWNRSHIGGEFQPQNQSYELNLKARRKMTWGTDMTMSFNNHADGKSYNPTATLELSQPLLKGAPKEIVMKDWFDAQDNEIINRLSYQKSLMSRITDIVKKYRQLIVNQNNLKTAEQALRDSERTFHNNEVQIKLGRMAKTVNVPQASQVESNRLSLEQGQNSLRQAKQTLLQSIGLDPDRSLATADNIDVVTMAVPEVQQTIEYALQHNIDYRIKLINLKKTKRNLAKAKDNLRWQLDLKASVSAGRRTGTDDDVRLRHLIKDENHRESLGLNLSVPLDNKDLKYAVAKQQLALEKEKNSLYQAKRELITSIKNTLINIHSQIKQLRIADKAVKLSRETYQVTLKKQQIGRASSLDVTNSQNDLVHKQINLIRTKVDYLNAMSDLDLNLAKTLTHWNIKVAV